MHFQIMQEVVCKYSVACLRALEKRPIIVGTRFGDRAKLKKQLKSDIDSQIYHIFQIFFGKF